MKLSDLRKEENEIIDKLREERTHKFLSAIESAISEEKIKFTNIAIRTNNRDDGNAKIEYTFSLPDGYSQQDSSLWEYDEPIEELIKKILKKAKYVYDLRKQYPEYAIKNDHIQKNRHYEKSICFNGYRRATINATLCPYLKLPNETECGFGGGDYEIKRTPERVKEFNENIDALCLFLADCISDLRKMKV